MMHTWYRSYDCTTKKSAGVATVSAATHTLLTSTSDEYIELEWFHYRNEHRCCHINININSTHALLTFAIWHAHDTRASISLQNCAQAEVRAGFAPSTTRHTHSWHVCMMYIRYRSYDFTAEMSAYVGTDNNLSWINALRAIDHGWAKSVCICAICATTETDRHSDRDRQMQRLRQTLGQTDATT